MGINKKRKHLQFRKTIASHVEKLERKIQGQIPKLFIAMPVYNSMESWTQSSLDRTIEYMRERGVQVARYSPHGISHIMNARNVCVQEFLNRKEYTHILWADDDMVWNPEDLEKMLLYTTHGVEGIFYDLKQEKWFRCTTKPEAVSALVCRKSPPFDPTIYTIGKASDEQGIGTFRVPLGEYPVDTPFYYPQSGIGTAFMLLTKEAMEKISEPWFSSPATERKTVHGEDYYFCLKLGASGVDILFDPCLRVYHIGRYPVGLEDHISYINMCKIKGIQPCHSLNFDVKDAAEFKSSFAGPQPSLIQQAVPAVNKALESSRFLGDLKLGLGLCQSPERGTPTSPVTKIITDVSKLPKPTDLTSQTEKTDSTPLKSDEKMPVY